MQHKRTLATPQQPGTGTEEELGKTQVGTAPVILIAQALETLLAMELWVRVMEYGEV